MENFNDIFNFNDADFIDKEARSESDLYKANAKDGKDNTYSALIRFIPWWKDPSAKGCKIKKYSYWLEDPLTGDGFSVDCPTTVNQKSVLQDLFFKLYKSPSVAEKKLSEKFKRRENYYALIQILKDEQHPELVGKIKIFKFGIKLNAILQSELKPEYGKAYNPFNPLTGRILSLKVSLQGGFNDPSQSKFVGEEFPCLMDNKKIENKPESMKAFFEYLKQNSPDLDKYAYREWDDEMKEKVKLVIENTVPSMRTTENILKAGNQSSTSNPSVNIDLGNKEDFSRYTKEEDPLKGLELGIEEPDENEFDNDLYKGL